MVIAPVQSHRAKKCLHSQRTSAIALLHGASGFLVGKKLGIREKPLQNATRIPVQGRAKFLLQPLRTSAQPLLTNHPLAREPQEGFRFPEAFGLGLFLKFFLASGSAPAFACERLARERSMARLT